MPGGRVVFEVVPKSEELQSLIRSRIVTACQLPGYDRFIVARYGVNSRTLKKLARQEVAQLGQK